MIRYLEKQSILESTINRFVQERLISAEHIVAETDEIPADIISQMKEL